MPAICYSYTKTVDQMIDTKLKNTFQKQITILHLLNNCYHIQVKDTILQAYCA